MLKFAGESGISGKSVVIYWFAPRLVGPLPVVGIDPCLIESADTHGAGAKIFSQALDLSCDDTRVKVDLFFRSKAPGLVISSSYGRVMPARLG